MTLEMRVCEIDGCNRRHHGRGLCNSHARRRLRGMDVEPPFRPYELRAYCATADCGKPPHAHGLCRRCFDQQRNKKVVG